jgi:hypothetical protein
MVKAKELLRALKVCSAKDCNKAYNRKDEIEQHHAHIDPLKELHVAIISSYVYHTLYSNLTQDSSHAQPAMGG